MDEVEIRSKIIDVLLNPSNDWRNIVIAIAKKHPEIVIEAGESITESDLPELDAFILRGEKIQAIKYLRSKRNIGLKEAKEFCDERDIVLRGFIQ